MSLAVRAQATRMGSDLPSKSNIRSAPRRCPRTRRRAQRVTDGAVTSLWAEAACALAPARAALENPTSRCRDDGLWHQREQAWGLAVAGRREASAWLLPPAESSEGWLPAA